MNRFLKALGQRVVPMPLNRINQEWSLDFVHDALADGRRIRILTIVDDYSRESLKMVVDTSLNGVRVRDELTKLMEIRGMPERILSDNGTEFTSTAILKWCYERGSPLGLHTARQAPAKWIHRELQQKSSEMNV